MNKLLKILLLLIYVTLFVSVILFIAHLIKTAGTARINNVDKPISSIR